jgi:hypothetical protein
MEARAPLFGLHSAGARLSLPMSRDLLAMLDEARKAADDWERRETQALVDCARSEVKIAVLHHAAQMVHDAEDPAATSRGARRSEREHHDRVVARDASARSALGRALADTRAAAEAYRARVRREVLREAADRVGESFRHAGGEGWAMIPSDDEDTVAEWLRAMADEEGKR